MEILQNWIIIGLLTALDIMLAGFFYIEYKALKGQGSI